LYVLVSAFTPRQCLLSQTDNITSINVERKGELLDGQLREKNRFNMPWECVTSNTDQTRVGTRNCICGLTRGVDVAGLLARSECNSNLKYTLQIYNRIPNAEVSEISIELGCI
jgi:hypothetical protein